MKDFSSYLHKRVRVICWDKTEFTGVVMSYGGEAQGKEEYGVAEAYISVYPGDCCYVLFEHEIEQIILENEN